MMKDFAQLFGGQRWLMAKDHLVALMRRAEAATPEMVEKAHAEAMAYADRAPSLNLVGDIAVIHMCGPITYKRSWFSMYFGSATIEDMQAQFRMALADSSVSKVAFKCDTPGGTAEFVPEFADEIYAARGQKPMLAFADTMIASAGIWLASQVDQIYVSASSEVGSVGAYCLHTDLSQLYANLGVKMTFITHGVNKVNGNPYEPLSDEARAEFQDAIDAIGDEFDGAMARGRGVTKKVVLDTFGQGKMFRGKNAISTGLADKSGTFNQIISKLTASKRRSAMAIGGVVADIEALASTESMGPATPKVEAPLAKRSDAVDPDDDGNCKEGYELRDGKCYPVEDGQDASASDELALAIALGND